MIRCVVFDFDGVLVQSNAIKREAYFEIFAEFGFPGAAAVRAVVDHVLGDRYVKIEAVLRQMREEGIPAPAPAAEVVQEYAARYNAICEDAVAKCAEVAGASATLRALASEVPLYINSATPREPLRRIVERKRWSSYFRGVLGRPESKTENLDSIRVAERLSAAEILFVGDTIGDLDAARGFGCRFVGIRNEFNNFEPGGVPMLDDLRPLPGLVLGESAATATTRLRSAPQC